MVGGMVLQSCEVVQVAYKSGVVIPDAASSGEHAPGQGAELFRGYLHRRHARDARDLRRVAPSFGNKAPDGPFFRRNRGHAEITSREILRRRMGD